MWVMGNQNAAAALHCWGRRLVSSVSPAAKIITGSELRLCRCCCGIVYKAARISIIFLFLLLPFVRPAARLLASYRTYSLPRSYSPFYHRAG